MKGLNGLLRWVMASVKKYDHSEELIYVIEFNDIFSLENISAESEHRISEYRYILSLSSDIAFEYSFETRHIKIYIFDCCREIILADEELEKWQGRAIESGQVLSRYIETFNTLCRDIKNGVYRFDYELETSVFTQGKSREMCLFRGITRWQDPVTKKVSGIISVINSRQKTKDINLALESKRNPPPLILPASPRVPSSFFTIPATVYIISSPKRWIKLSILHSKKARTAMSYIILKSMVLLKRILKIK